ncbi:hypothetical protein FE257_004984 [Aspergillus nanangensis]|uniref:Uncharacterized protein n=1 Tax=Aspergillus nanangensis TaxID=2582783 RepID=A0AAD4CQV8_ASPNN|nr:hypothetical protein FE257_004984 [Aspergillus nanangensis]
MGDLTIPSWLPPPSALSIVVSRYKEPLDIWGDVAPNVYLYAKFDTPQVNDSIPHDSFRHYELLPNAGREGQTYCHHIYTHYDNLEPIVIFSQGDPFDILVPQTNNTEQLVRTAQESLLQDFDPVTIYNYDLLHDVAEWGPIDWSSPEEGYWITPKQLETLTPAPYDMAEFWQRLFLEPHPVAVRVLHGAVFAVRRETIWRHPPEFYRRCLDQFADAGKNAVNPEIGFFMERAWLAAWSKGNWKDRVEIP